MSAVEALKAQVHGDSHVVYLIHLQEPMRHARHYVGSTSDLVERMRCYRAGNADSSAFMRAVHRAGIGWHISRVWTFESKSAARSFEYSFKKSGKVPQTRHSVRECPCCREAALARNAALIRAKRASARPNPEAPSERTG